MQVSGWLDLSATYAFRSIVCDQHPYSFQALVCSSSKWEEEEYLYNVVVVRWNA